GFQDKTGGDTSVTPTKITCPSGSGTCYQVVITRRVPLYLSQIVGYTGDSTLNGTSRMATTIAAKAVASAKVFYNYCLVGLGTTPNAGPGAGQNNVALNGNGGDFTQCAARSNGQVKCTAVDFAIIQAPSEQGATCGSDYASASNSFTDPYASKNVTSLIANTMASAPACSASVPATITAAVTVICSTTAALGQNTTISQTDPANPPIIIVNNTTFNLNGHTLTTATGSTATIIFTGPGTSGLPDWFSGDGSVTIQGANGGTYDDFSIINDPKYTTTAAFNPGGGSHFVLDVLGTVYVPNTDVVIQGSMNSTIGSRSCVSIIAKSIYVNGGSLDNDPLDCVALGFDLAQTQVARQTLVL
ncbi:MAG TPA: hypothetical protein VFN88_03900, partial [Caulobacteraceae bacterium]|nr:hypothetical protein [Caulobacteraceae bacterium]